jgi:hypothetical protein
MRSGIAAAVALVCTVLLVPAALAANTDATTCEGAIGAVVLDHLIVPEGATCTLDGTQVLGDVTVEAGATLTAEFVRIGGGVTLAPGSRFRTSDSAIDRDTTCAGCSQLVMVFMFDPVDFIPVEGDIHVAGMTDGHLHIEAGRISGDVEVTDSSGDFTFIDNSIAGKLLFTNNVGNAGFWFTSAERAIEITGNTGAGAGFPADLTLVSVHAGKNLVFSGNTGPSDISESSAGKDLECFDNDPAPVGWGNSAGKDIEGQCAVLTGPFPEA